MKWMECLSQWNSSNAQTQSLRKSSDTNTFYYVNSRYRIIIWCNSIWAPWFTKSNFRFDFKSCLINPMAADFNSHSLSLCHAWHIDIHIHTRARKMSCCAHLISLTNPRHTCSYVWIFYCVNHRIACDTYCCVIYLF